MTGVAQTAREKKSGRNTALDVTKGALVLMMVLYHWCNYFLGLEIGIYSYMRFLTPSFIFIAGTLIPSVYIARYSATDSRAPMRLATRGGKLLALFTILNTVASFLASFRYGVRPSTFVAATTGQRVGLYVLGATGGAAKGIAFPILVPIGVLLCLGAALVIAKRRYARAIEVAWMISIAAALILELNGVEIVNLELVSMGLLGAVLGTSAFTAVEAFARRPYSDLLLALIYGAYLYGVYSYGSPFFLQILGVCVSIWCIYRIGVCRWWDDSHIGKTVARLGQYSLVGYISQIAILQILRRIAPGRWYSPYVLGALLAIAVALTIATVEVVHALRRRSARVDRMYRIVFA